MSETPSPLAWQTPASSPLRSIFLGSPCAASAAALRGLQDAGLQIEAVILAGAPGRSASAPAHAAALSSASVTWVAGARDLAAEMAAIAPHVAVAACFPWRVPRVARQIPPLGILNIHPSPLPAGRGPQPVFWTLRRGEQITGVTVHRMDGGLDTGPLVAQETVPVSPGVSAPELENSLMARGARLLVTTLPGLAAGDLQPWPQPVAGVTLAPEPSPADWTMPASLPAAWAWRFARGVAPLGGPLTAIAGGQAIPVVAALDWSPDERLPEAVIDGGDGMVRVRFSPGWVRFRRA